MSGGTKSSSCPKGHVHCVNCLNHFSQLRPSIKEVVATKHFMRDAPDFNVNLIMDCEHEQFTHLHKFEGLVHGHHIFRALINHTHIVYAVDKKQRLVFMRAFKNYKQYTKFLEDKKRIASMLDS